MDTVFEGAMVRYNRNYNNGTYNTVYNRISLYGDVVDVDWFMNTLIDACCELCGASHWYGSLKALDTFLRHLGDPEVKVAVRLHLLNFET